MSSINNRRSQSVNSNAGYIGTAIQGKNQQASHSNVSNLFQNQKSKNKSQQYKKLLQLRLNNDDISTLLSCYQSREDSIFQMRVCVMQILENIQGKSSTEIQNIVRNISHILLDTERIRFMEENKVIEKYASPLIQPIFLENNSSAKQMVFRYGSKLNKINNSYYQKIQFYFPRMAELIQQEQCTWNSQFKESLQSIMSNSSYGGNQNTQSISSQSQQSNHTNSANNNKVQLTSVLKHIVVKSRQKFQKEHLKFTCYQYAYGGLIEKIVGVPKQVDKCNKNEKFFIDKYIQGSTAFAYTQLLTQKYLIKTSNKYITIGYNLQMRQAVRQTWRNPYDILQLEDKKQESKTVNVQISVGNLGQSANGATPISSSCVSTSKTNSNYESLWEIIVTNYDKNIKEMFSYNRSINNQIKAYIESYHKRDQQQNKSQILMQSNLYLNKNQIKQFNVLSTVKGNSQSQSKDLIINEGENQAKQIQQNIFQEFKTSQQDKITGQEGNNQNISQDFDEILLKDQENKQIRLGQQQIEIGDQQSETLDQNQDDDKSLQKSQTSPKFSISQNSLSLSLSQRKQLSQSYQTYLDEDQIKMSSQLNQENQKNYKTDYYSNDCEYASDCKDQVSNNDDISVYEEFFTKQNDISEQNANVQIQKQEDRSNSLLENSQSKTVDVSNFYSRCKQKSFQDSLGEYQFVPKRQVNDFKNKIPLKTIEPEENSFQLVINPYKKRRNQKQGEFNINGQDENMLQNQQIKLNSKVNLSNIQNKELTRVILNPFSSEIIPNSCINSNSYNKKINEMYLKQGGRNSVQSISLKTSSSNINLSSPNQASNIMNQPNIFSYQISSANKANFEVNNSLSSSSKSSKIRFSLTSIQKQKDYPYIDQFHQIFESKKKNVIQQCPQNQQLQIQNSIVNHQLSNTNLKSNTFTNDTYAYDGQDEILPPLLEVNNYAKKQKQIKIFTITQREASYQQQNENMQLKQIANDQQGYFSSQNQINSVGNTGLTSPSSNIHLTSLTKFPADSISNNQNINNQQHSTQNSINSYRIPNNQKSELPSNTSSQVNIISSCTNINVSSSQNKTMDVSNINNNNQKANTTNNQNTPKANYQLKMNHKMYSGPTFNALKTNKHNQATPIKSNNFGSTKSKRQQTVSSDQQANLIKSINIKQINAQDPAQSNQNQKFCNLNLDSNIYSSLYFDQQPMNLPEILYKTSQTPSIGKTQMSIPPDSLHLLKQNYNNVQKKHFDSSNQTGQFINLNTSNSNQPVLTRISNAVQGSFSPLKLDSIEQRRQLSIKNNENMQLSISKRNESFNRKSINSTQNIAQQQQNQQQQQQLQQSQLQQQQLTYSQQAGNIFNNTPQLRNVNRQKKYL
ncbi:hypothetical protein ABPG72_022135 [Tetrahymena utriculariae]